MSCRLTWLKLRDFEITSRIKNNAKSPDTHIYPCTTMINLHVFVLFRCIHRPVLDGQTQTLDDADGGASHAEANSGNCFLVK